MAGVLSDDSVPVRLDDGFNLVSKVSVKHARLAHGDRCLYRLFGGTNQFGRLITDFADGVRSVQVSVETAVVECDIEVDNVALF